MSTIKQLDTGDKILLEDSSLEGNPVVLIKGVSPDNNKPIFYTDRAYHFGAFKSHDVSSGIGATNYNNAINTFGSVVSEELSKGLGDMGQQGSIYMSRGYQIENVNKQMPINPEFPYIFMANEKLLRDSGVLNAQGIMSFKPSGVSDTLPLYNVISGEYWASGHRMNDGRGNYYTPDQEDIRRVFAVSIGVNYADAKLDKLPNGMYVLIKKPSNLGMHVKVNGSWKKVKELYV